MRLDTEPYDKGLQLVDPQPQSPRSLNAPQPQTGAQQAMERLASNREKKLRRRDRQDSVEVFLDRLGLHRVPPALWLFGWTTKLSLAHNELSWLPAEIGNLRALTHLELNNNKLTVLPAEIGLLKSLQRLNLMHNQLERLPVELCELSDELLQLYLSGNLIEEPPPRVWMQGIRAIRVHFDR